MRHIDTDTEIMRRLLFDWACDKWLPFNNSQSVKFDSEFIYYSIRCRNFNRISARVGNLNFQELNLAQK